MLVFNKKSGNGRIPTNCEFFLGKIEQKKEVKGNYLQPLL